MPPIADPQFRQNVDDDYMREIVSKINRPPVCTVKRTGTLAITQSVDTVITWQAEEGNDFDGMWDAAAPTVLTVQTEGLYVVRGQIRTNSVTADEWYLDILKNGATNAASVASAIWYGGTPAGACQITTYPIMCAISDTFRLMCRTNVASKSLQTSRGGTWLSAQWVGFGS